MKIVSWNVNGLRAVEKRKDIHRLLEQEDPDVLFMQEVKAMREQLSEYLTVNENYHQYYQSAEKKGYSGVSVWVKKAFLKEEPEIHRGMPNWNDSEGRIINASFNSFSLFGIYFPNGGKSDQAYKDKLKFYDCFKEHIANLRKQKKKVIFTGDLNIAHKPIDLARPKQNENTTGFTAAEREKLDELVSDNWIDIFRRKRPEEVAYTWWRTASNARARNVGWRIDYFILDKALIEDVKDDYHLTDFTGSDHCPIVLIMKD